MSAAGSARPEEVDPDAFDLRPSVEEANGAAALCLHGLTGTPYEVRPVAEALVARGVRARGPWMAGHEEGVEALSKSSWQEWVEGARAEWSALRAEHDRVFLVGMSMGGLVSLRIAETEEVDAIVVIGTPRARRKGTSPKPAGHALFRGRGTDFPAVRSDSRPRQGSCADSRGSRATRPDRTATRCEANFRRRWIERQGTLLSRAIGTCRNRRLRRSGPGAGGGRFSRTTLEISQNRTPKPLDCAPWDRLR